MTLPNWNALTLEVYEPFSTTPVFDLSNDLDRAAISFETFWPGGRAGTAIITVTRDPGRMWLFRQGQRIVIRNGLQVVYEGAITNPGFGERQRTIEAAGYWGIPLLGSQWRDKRWCDTRIEDASWTTMTVDDGATGAEKCTDDRRDRIRFTPKDVPWASGEYAAVRYGMAYGQTVARLTYDYDFSELATEPAAIALLDAGGFSGLANTYDGQAATSESVLLQTTRTLYAGFHAGQTDRFATGETVFVRFDLGASVNNNAATLTVEYWDGGAWAAVSGLSDGTASGGAPFAQDGNLSFTRPGDWAPNEVDGVTKLWLRVTTSADLDTVTVNEISIGQQQAWEISLWRFALPSTWTQVTGASGDTFNTGSTSVITATGTGSIDVELAGSPRFVELRFYARNKQSPYGNGTVYGEFSDVRVFSETGDITPAEIAKDWIDEISNLNADVSQVDANTLAMEPWLTEGHNGFETAAANLARLAQYGDASGNQWAAYVLPSETSTTSNDGKPVLAFKQAPALTDYDYEMSLAEALAGGAEMLKTVVYNQVIAAFTDARGRPNALSYSEDGNLTDTASVTKYGARQYILPDQFVSETAASKAGRRYIAGHKDEHILITSPIRVTGAVRGKHGVMVPAANVYAGQRIRITDVLVDEVGIAGAGLTFLITHTHYDDPTQTVEISCGGSGQFPILLTASVGSANIGRIQPPRN
jgi:hypothetical protein